MAFLKNLYNASKSAVSNGFSILFKGPQSVIATGLLAGVTLAAAAAATVAFVPAALAAVVGFSVAGVSIASLVGSAFIAQVAAVATLAFAATLASVFSFVAAIGAVRAIKGLFTKAAPDAEQAPIAAEGDDAVVESTSVINAGLTAANTQEVAVAPAQDAPAEDVLAENAPAAPAEDVVAQDTPAAPAQDVAHSPTLFAPAPDANELVVNNTQEDQDEDQAADNVTLVRSNSTDSTASTASFK